MYSIIIASYSAEVVFINLSCTGRMVVGKTVGFCKHKSSALYNQAVEMIYSSQATIKLLKPRSGA